MALIDWSDSLSVKVSIIDSQHKKLIDLINNLNEAMKGGKSKEIVGDIVKSLIEYTEEHFQKEEGYFDQFGYPEADRHKLEHRDFVKKVSDIKEKFDSGSIFLSIEIMNFLKTWLQNHIMKTDKKYSDFFIENGLR